MTHYNSPSCECKPCVVIRQHKAIQAYGAAGKEPIVGLPSPQEETESMVPCKIGTFLSNDPDAEQSVVMSDHHAVDVQMALERGLFYGFGAALVVVAVLTLTLLAFYH